ncbi:hypothetical protein EON62_05350, partial [archaeon]
MCAAVPCAVAIRVAHACAALPRVCAGDELAAAWEVFTPLLHRLERERIAPIIYPFGSRGPQASDKLIKKYGYVYESRYAGGWRVSEDPSASSAMLTGIREAFKLPTE